MFSDTITLFNHYQSRLGDTWYPTILHNVHLDMDKAAIIAKYGPESSDNAMLHVKYAVEDSKKMVGVKKIIDGEWVISKKQWLSPKEWHDAPNDNYSNLLTFNDCENFDFLMLGEWEGGEEPVSDNDYTEGFYHQLNKEHDYVFSITAVGGPYKTIPHFEIMGR